jgi:hypothetical protein
MDDQLIDAENSSQDDENDHGEGYSAHVTSIGFQDLELLFPIGTFVTHPFPK